jgi:hypothetical protein
LSNSDRIRKRRLKGIVVNSAKHIRQAEESTNMYIAYHHAVAADSILKSAKDMVKTSFQVLSFRSEAVL